MSCGHVNSVGSVLHVHVCINLLQNEFDFPSLIIGKKITTAAEKEITANAAVTSGITLLCALN